MGVRPMELQERVEKIAAGLKVAEAMSNYSHGLAAEDHKVVDIRQARTGQALAIVEVMFLMAAVDGEVSAEELAELHASLGALADMHQVDDIGLEEMLEELNDKLQRHGWRRRLEDAAGRLKAAEDRVFAFQLAASVAFVDDFVAHAEAAAIESLAKLFGFDSRESEELLREVHEVLAP